MRLMIGGETPEIMFAESGFMDKEVKGQRRTR